MAVMNARSSLPTICTAVLLLSALAAAAATDAAVSTSAPSAPLHDRMVSEYLGSKWAELAKELPTISKQAAALKPSERADIEYIRKTLAECRPVWWDRCKAGGKVSFRPSIWGRTLPATFDPAAKTNIGMNFVNDQASVTFKWDAADMDNPDEAEHGFSKGELTNLQIWLLLGTAESWSLVPPQTQLKLEPDEKLLLQHYLQFRGNVAGAYYASPRARRWGLWLDLGAFNPAYAKASDRMAREAMAAMFMAEVLGHRDKYPSIQIVEASPEGAIEPKLAGELKTWIEKHGLTLSEDESLRAAIKSFAVANAAKVRQSAKVTLPNATFIALDPDADQPLSADRETWLKAHLHPAAAR